MRLLASALLAQAIGNIFWFIIGCWILATSLMGERKPFDVASGVFFFLSGAFDLVLSVSLFSFRKTLFYTVQHLPALSTHEVNSRLLTEQEKYLRFVNICYPGMIGSLGMAFFCIGIYYLQFSTDVLHEAKKVTLSVPPEVQSGVGRIRWGSGCYILLALTNLLQALTFAGVVPDVVPSSVYSLAFFLWIIGMVLISSGSKKIGEATKQGTHEFDRFNEGDETEGPPKGENEASNEGDRDAS